MDSQASLYPCFCGHSYLASSLLIYESIFDLILSNQQCRLEIPKTNVHL